MSLAISLTMLCQECAHCKGEAEYAGAMFTGVIAIGMKILPKVARMRVQVHIEWMEELDARGKRLQVEVKELKTELEEIGRLNLEHEKENELLRKALARFDAFST